MAGLMMEQRIQGIDIRSQKNQSQIHLSSLPLSLFLSAPPRRHRHYHDAESLSAFCKHLILHLLPSSPSSSVVCCCRRRHRPPLHRRRMILNMAEINVNHELDIVRKLAELTPIPSERSIFRVYDRLRNEKKNAYEPQVVAIGPYHHGKHNLQPMEEHKLRYLQQLCNRGNEGTVGGYLEAMRGLEQKVRELEQKVRGLEPKAREFYAEPISLDSNAFVEMMLLDSCFIIEFLLKFKELELYCPATIFQIEPNDPIFWIEHIRRGIFRDLVLFENQLPLFIVEELFNMTGDYTDSLDDFLRQFTMYFYWITPRQGFPVTTANIKHLLSLLHYRCCYQFHSNISLTSELKYNPRKSATELHEAGIKFKKVETVLDLPRPPKEPQFIPLSGAPQFIPLSGAPQVTPVCWEIGDRDLFDIRFVNGTMEIPTLVVEDDTESVLRNLIAYEQYLPDKTWHHFTAYHKFIDYLVNTSKDVEILTHHGIIRNFLGENEVVATMLNKLGNNTVASDIGYEEVYNKLNEHCRKKWNVWLAILRRDYFNNPWALISFLAAAGLLLLSLLQTTFTIHPAGKSN